MGLHLSLQILNCLLKVDEWNPSDQISVLAGCFIGKGCGVKQTCLAGLGIPLNNRINLLIANGEFGGNALEGWWLNGYGRLLLTRRQQTCDGNEGEGG